jgi:hypothetical protein
VAARVLHDLRRGVETHRLAVQQRAGEGGRFVALQPGGDIHQQREAGGMRLGEAVFAEALDLHEDLPREVLLVAALAHAIDEAALELLEPALAPPCRHRAAQLVGFARGEARGDHRELHHLLLEDRHAERPLQHAAHRLARVADRLDLFAPAQIGMHHAALDRARAHDGDLDHQVIEAARLHARQHGHLRARFDLEHAQRVGVADHVVDRRVLGRHVAHRERPPAHRAHQVERAADGGEHAEREHVDLQQAQRVEIVLVPLDDGAFGHRRVFDRHQMRQLPSRNDEAADVLRQVARKADQFVDQTDQQRDLPVFWIEAGFRQALGLDLAAVPPRHRFRQAVDLLKVEAERLADVAHGALWPVGDDGGGKCCALAAIFRVEVLDHFLAPLVLEIDVDIGRLVALARNEALEQHFHAGRVHLGDAQRVAHRRVRRRAAPLTEDAAAAGEADDVVHGEEVRLVPEFLDERELMLYRGIA